MTVVGDKLTELLQHRRIDPESDAILDAIIGAIGDAADRVALIGYGDPASDTPGERVLRDPRVAPLWALAHAALYSGAKLPGRLAGESDVDFLARARDAVVYPFGMRRGTHEAIRRALAPYLTGTKTVYISDRYGGPYDLYVRTLPAETPDGAECRAVLEGGFISGDQPGVIRAEQLLTYVVSTGVAWAEAGPTRTWASVADGVTWANVTNADVS